MKQHTLVISSIPNVTPFVIPKYQLKFLHATVNSAINNHKPPYTHSKFIGIIHNNHRSNPKMLEEVLASGASDTTTNRKPRILCLHGFRTSGEILETQLNKKWPESVLEKLELFFPDAPFPCNGRSQVEGIFDPPYYEWFQSNESYTEYPNLDKCLEYIEECMIKHAPIDGLLGFSQGAILSAALPGLQAKGLALTRVSKIKFVVIVSGAQFKNESWNEKAYSVPIQCPSLHFIGDADFMKPYSTQLLKSVEDSVVIHHSKGHTIPRFDEVGLEKMLKFIDRIQNIVSSKEEEEEEEEEDVVGF